MKDNTKKQSPTGRILCINDFPMYSRMVALFLERDGGHTVQTEIVPVNFKEVAAFNPDVIVINICRKLETISSGGMHDFYTEVDGARAFRELSRAVKAGQVHAPVIVTALAVLERELPKDEGLAYIAFVEVPHKFDALLTIICKVLEAKASGGPVLPE
jgi:hypothetical protein